MFSSHANYSEEKQDSLQTPHPLQFYITSKSRIRILCQTKDCLAWTIRECFDWIKEQLLPVIAKSKLNHILSRTHLNKFHIADSTPNSTTGCSQFWKKTSSPTPIVNIRLKCLVSYDRLGQKTSDQTILCVKRRGIWRHQLSKHAILETTTSEWHIILVFN